jgi:hypothetical protein
MIDTGFFQEFSCCGFGARDFLQLFAQNPAELPMFPLGHHDGTNLQNVFSDDLQKFLRENCVRAWLLDGMW